ncbi:hypothetical protein GP486_000983 [Trichoglossum hirsutum]|uniref:Nucleoporin Nup54 alpha-helical domain-containing protein n=1 Tax=Trichoglossum hirsutum TaxID=265104 RepID=A0A9P8LHS2_9PEZI|nr:hypothetical protein GP486_000983 [Trichoglossum hirsutum]
MFGSSTGGGFGTSQTQQATNPFASTSNKPSLFGSLNTGLQPQQQQTGLLGASQQQQPQISSTFGGNTQQQQPQSISLFGASTQQGGGLFGSSTQQQNPFGSSTQQQQPSTGGLFGQPQQPTGTLFGGQQQQPLNSGLFGQSQSIQPQKLGTSSLWSPGAGLSSRQKSIPEQIEQIYEKWNPASPNCAFQYYFYNYVGPEKAPFFRPTAREDEKKWEEALSRKPEAGYVPVIAIGFQELFARIGTQMQTLNAYNTRLHEINGCLEAMLQKHDLVITIRAMDAKRRHTALSQRCLALATKVQVLRNRGYAMGGDEEDLKKKLIELEKGVFDPALGGRAEEIWARMVGIRERTKILQEEMARMGRKTAEGNGLSEEVLKQAEKVSATLKIERK